VKEEGRRKVEEGEGSDKLGRNRRKDRKQGKGK
jgi:hypothetical protein